MSQPNRLDRHKSVISQATITVDDPAARVGIDTTQTATAGNFPDYRVKLSLLTEYLLEATKRDFAPLTLDSRKVDDDVRAARPRLWRLWQIRCAAKQWLPLLDSAQPNDPRVIKAAADAAELLREVMK
jgi:hypothetical protein